MTTYRERREARADQLREWADKREARADVAYEQSHQLADMIPFGQPILVGHHSEKRHRRHIERIDSAARQSVENSDKAQDMASRADEIDRQAANAIYSDDVDARERLEAKIATLEAERGRIKAYNATCRKAAKAGEQFGDLSLLDDKQRENVGALARINWLRPGGALDMTNLGANIRRLQQRLASLDRPPVDRMILARFDSECADCGAELHRGDTIRYSKQQGARCVTCKEQSNA